MTFRIAHLSDPHLAPLPKLTLQQLASKRFFGALNWWRGRNKIHRQDILDQILRDMANQKPDHIILSGDFTNLALEQEFKNTKQWLQSFGDPQQLSIVPGNHDAYVKGALESGSHILGDYLPQQIENYPIVQQRGQIAFINLSTAVPTPAFMATGALGAEQLARLKTILLDLKKENIIRIIVLHHALRVPLKKWLKRLNDTQELQQILFECGAELIVHGHLHLFMEYWVAGPEKNIPVIGVPSASSDPNISSKPAGYALYHIEPETRQIKIELRELSQRGDIFTRALREFAL